MSLVDVGADITMSHVVTSQHVTAFIGATPCYSEEFTVRSPDRYMLGLAITPRPQGAWAKYDVSREKAEMGEIMMYPPDLVQHGSLSPWTGIRKDFCCVFPKAKFESLMLGVIDWSESNLRETVNLRNTNIRFAVQRMGHELLSPGMAAAVVLDSLTALIAVDLSRHFQRDRAAEKRPRHLLAKYEVDKIDAFIHAHSADEIYLSDLAELCQLSVRHFSRIFKATTGFTIANYVASKRLQIAQDMLAHTSVPIKMVASKVGFSSVSNFTNAFKRLSGVTPSNFRYLVR